jgi:hypothetical protein
LAAVLAQFDGAGVCLVYAGAPGILLRAEGRPGLPGRRAHVDAWTGGRAVVDAPAIIEIPIDPDTGGCGQSPGLAAIGPPIDAGAIRSD